MNRKVAAAVSHHDREVAELRADRELAVEYLKAAMESLDDPDNRAANLLALRTVAEAYGGLGAVAAEAGISRESLYRTLSAKGNPTLKTLLAVLKGRRHEAFSGAGATRRCLNLAVRAASTPATVGAGRVGASGREHGPVNRHPGKVGAGGTAKASARFWSYGAGTSGGTAANGTISAAARVTRSLRSGESYEK